jgi:TonB family protein
VFDRAALAAVRRWRFAPVVVNGSVTEAAMETTVSFKMGDEAKH